MNKLMAGEIKQGVINQETIKANTPAQRFRIRVKGFTGSYGGVWFDDEGQSREKVDQKWVDKFNGGFPR
jgi:hypothetical protein